MVTHPFHPLCGERLEVLFSRRCGVSRLYVREGGSLGTIGILEEATDRGPEPAERALSFEVLAGLAALVAALGGSGGGAMNHAVSLTLSELDARVLRAVEPFRERTAERIAGLAGCSEDVARSCLRRLRMGMLVEVDGSRPSRWLRTRDGDVALEHQP